MRLSRLRSSCSMEALRENYVEQLRIYSAHSADDAQTEMNYIYEHIMCQARRLGKTHEGQLGVPQRYVEQRSKHPPPAHWVYAPQHVAERLHMHRKLQGHIFFAPSYRCPLDCQRPAADPSDEAAQLC